MASDASQSAEPTPRRKTNSSNQTDRVGGRPPVIELKKLEAFMSVYPTLETTARFFNTTTKTVERTIRRNYKATFVQFRERFITNLKHNLVQKALHRAMVEDSDRMLEICLKNVVGWDGTGSASTVEKPVIQLQYNLDAPPALPQPADVIEVTAAEPAAITTVEPT
jgi:lysyl-tRNA synthetase class II